jgi:hypothetical protein
MKSRTLFAAICGQPVEKHCNRWLYYLFRFTPLRPLSFLYLSKYAHHHHHHMALQPKSGPGLPYWGFVTITFLQGWIVSQAPKPNLEDQVSVFVTPGDRVPQIYPRHWVPILVDFYDMHGLQRDYCLIPVTTRGKNTHRLI